MKKNITILVAAAALASLAACSPIEDQSLREKYITNVSDYLTSEELTSCLTVEQNGVTNDIITVTNSNPEFGGVWHFTTAAGDAILKSDKGVYTYTANGNFEVYMVAPAGGGKTVESKHFPITVTDVYDPWVGYLTGAKSNTDKDATKTWGFRPVTAMGADTDDPSGYICAMSAYGFWKWYPHTQISGQAWWGQVTFAKTGDQKMKFSYNGTKLETFDAAGNPMNTGGFAVSHTPLDASPANTSKGCAQMGTFTATCPLIGAENDDYGQSGTTTFLLIYLDDNYMTLAHYPGTCSSATDWCDAAHMVYFKAK